MKSKRSLFCLIVFITSIVISCSWQIPENVSVKTKADYEFGVGRVTKSLDENLDIKKMIGDTLPQGMEIYDYFPNKKDPNTQRYLLRVPIVEIPLDLSEYMKQLDFSESIKGIDIPEQKVTIPEVKIDPFTVPLDVTVVKDTLKTGIRSAGLVTTTETALFPASYLEEAGVTIGNITFTKGNLEFVGANISKELAALGINTKVTIPGKGEVSLSDLPFSDVINSSRKLSIDFGMGAGFETVPYTVVNNKITVPLAGKTVNVTKAKYKFDSEPTLPANLEGFKANLSADAVIKSVTGFTLNKRDGSGKVETDNLGNPIPEVLKFNIPEQTIPNIITPETGLIYCTVGTGKIDLALDGFESNYVIKVKSAGGITIPEQVIDPENGIKLDGITVRSGDSKISGSTEFKLQNTGITFEPLPALKITPSISKISSATADLAVADPEIAKNFSFEKTFPLPKEVTEMVKSIGIKPSGIKVDYQNTFPLNNDISLELTSDFFKMNKKSLTLKGAGETGIPQKGEILSDKVTIDIASQKKDPEGNVLIGFKVDVKLPGYDSAHPTYVTVNNVESGKEYKIKMTVTPVIEWESITLNTQKFNHVGEQDLNIDINKIITDLEKQLAGETGNVDLGLTEIEFQQLPIYLYCTKPVFTDGSNPLDKLIIEGSADLKIGDKATESIMKNSALSFKDLPKLEIDPVSKAVISDISDQTKYPSSVDIDMSSIVNKAVKTPGNLKLSYSMAVSNDKGQSEVTIREDQLPKGDAAKTKIAVEAYIDLGFAMNIAKDLNLNMTGLLGLNGDILQGNLPKLKEQGLDKVLAAIKEVGINYTLNALPIKLPDNGKLDLVMKFNSIPEKRIDLIKGKVAITNEDVKNMFSQNTLELNNLSIVIPQGRFSIPRKKDVDLNLAVNIKTDGTIDIVENGSLTLGGGAK